VANSTCHIKEGALCDYDAIPVDDIRDRTACLGVKRGGECQWTCSKGYTGTHTILTCQESGNFSGSPPTCVANECETITSQHPIPGLNHSDCLGKSTTQSCTVVCDKGYTDPVRDLQGKHELCQKEQATSRGRLTCATSGEFTGDVPTCEAKTCSTTPANAAEAGPWPYVAPMSFVSNILNHSDCESRTTGESCAWSCAQGYHDSVPRRLFCQPDGEFTAPEGLPNCEPSSCDIRTIPDESHNFVKSKFDMSDCAANGNTTDTCTVLCARGYRMEHRKPYGTNFFHCEVTGAFAPPFRTEEGPIMPRCVPEPCSLTSIADPDKPVGFLGDILNKNDCLGRTTTSTCSIGCAVGFSDSRLSSGDSIGASESGQAGNLQTCQQNGSFTGDVPACIGKLCDISTISSADNILRTDCDDRRYTESCTVTCKPDFKGRPTLQTCQANGSFTGETPSCYLPPYATAFQPAHQAEEIAADASICVTFNEVINRGSGLALLHSQVQSQPWQVQLDVADDEQAVIDDRTICLLLVGSLFYGQAHELLLPEGAVISETGARSEPVLPGDYTFTVRKYMDCSVDGTLQCFQ